MLVSNQPTMSMAHAKVFTQQLQVDQARCPTAAEEATALALLVPRAAAWLPAAALALSVPSAAASESETAAASYPLARLSAPATASAAGPSARAAALDTAVALPEAGVEGTGTGASGTGA